MKDNKRRNSLTGNAAALATGSVVNLAAVAAARAAEPDPILGAIERYKSAYAFHADCLDKVAADEADDSLSRVGSKAEIDAIDALLQTAPTTTEGARALIDLLLNEAEEELVTTLGADFNSEPALSFLRSMAAFLERLRA